MDEFICTLCPVMYKTFKDFQSHYVKTHKNHPGFYVACNVASCAYSTRSWASFKMHMHRKHPAPDNSPTDGNDVNVLHCESDRHDTDSDTHNAEEDLQSFDFNMAYTLSLQAEHNMSQAAIDKVVSSTSTLVEQHLDHYKSQLKRKFTELGIDPTVCDSVPTDILLDAFDSNAKRQKVYSSDLKTLLHPQKVKLGERIVTVKGKHKNCANFGYFVPLKENLVNLLHMQEVWECVQNPHHSNDHSDFKYDVCDGAAIKEHPLFSIDQKALQIFMNCDDLEIVNPIGTHVKKNKVSVFYFTLGNIPPHLRSRLQVIQLVAIAKTIHVRDANALQKLLADFLHTLNELSVGIDMHIFGTQMRIRGALVFASADTLASNWLGGFKEGVSFALKNCRVCDLENKKLSTVKSEAEVTRRTMQAHRERCAHLHSDLNPLSKETRAYWSKLWGINSSSVLMQVPHFDLIAGLVQDPMHVLLEGVALHELSHALNHFIWVKKYFTLRWLNTCIQGFAYSYLHVKDKPAPIEKQHLSEKGNLRQTAAGMLTLMQTFPFMIANKVERDDAHWLNFLRLVQITIFCTSTYSGEYTSVYLDILIQEYLSSFQKLYPKASFIPKMHYLVHFPSQMTMFGPLRHHWCMRYEGKNGYFSNVRYKNFKNLPLTLAKRHQLHMAFKQSGYTEGRNPNYLYEGDIVGKGSLLKFSEVYPQLLDTKQTVLPDSSDEVYVCSSTAIHGKEYRKGCALVLNYADDDEPTFAFLDSVVVVDHVKYFVLKVMSATFDLHILSYILTPTDKMDFIPFTQLKFRWPLSVYRYLGKNVVMNSNSHTYDHVF